MHEHVPIALGQTTSVPAMVMGSSALVSELEIHRPLPGDLTQLSSKSAWLPTCPPV